MIHEEKSRSPEPQNIDVKQCLQLVIIPNILFGIKQTTTLNAINYKYFLFAIATNR